MKCYVQYFLLAYLIKKKFILKTFTNPLAHQKKMTQILEPMQKKSFMLVFKRVRSCDLYDWFSLS